MKRSVWAPSARSVELVTPNRRLRMTAADGGWWSVECPDDVARLDYAFSVDGGYPLADPRSRWQPEGVHGFSRPVDHDAFRWTDDRWRQPPLSSALIYEIHVGTFTPAGTFESAIEKLDYLVALGVSHVELMPVAEFSGSCGWGYDGVDLFAPHHDYGGPEGMKRFVEACHARGLGVILDVVYNHLGPDGNYLASYGPYLTDRYKTPWGTAVNLDGAKSHEVRRFLCDNAISWLADYHVDGLRIDAIHTIFDMSAIHFLEQLAGEVRRLEAATQRPLVVIAESDLNQPRIVAPVDAGGYGLDAQWSDDFHHAIHAYVTGERGGYYADFGALADIARALTNVFVYDGRYSKFRDRIHGRPVVGPAPGRFVSFIQNHDQVGNRARGERLNHLVEPDVFKIAAALCLLSPFVPLMFQGEEWGASSPFQYFTSYKDLELGEAVSRGRRAEFAELVGSESEVPDPQSYETFARSRLKWEERDTEPHKDILEWYRDLIRLRRSAHDFSDTLSRPNEVAFDEAARWLTMRRGNSRIICNFAERACSVPLGLSGAQLDVALASKTGVEWRPEVVSMPPRSVAVLTPRDNVSHVT